MEDYPENIMEFEKRFSTEEACRDCLYAVKIEPILYNYIKKNEKN